MKPPRRSFLPALTVGAAALAFVGGASVRERADAAPAPGPVESRPNLVADLGRTAPGEDYFRDLVSLLQREYVEPVTDVQKLASGAVKGMVASLNDPKSLYMDADAFARFVERRQGRYQGVGAEFSLELRGEPNPRAATAEEGGDAETAETALVSMVRVPRLVVRTVVPGGPADRAGVRPGDLVYSVDDRWLVNTDLIVRFERAQARFLDKKITVGEFNAVRKEVRERTQRAWLPLRAAERLSEGTTGETVVVWERGKEKRTTRLTRAVTLAPATGAVRGGVPVVRVEPGGLKGLAALVKGKREVTLDLRNNVGADLGAARQFLETVAPPGVYGRIVSERDKAGRPLTVKTGNPSPPRLVLKVDGTTRGAAEIVALALEAAGRAKLVGSRTGGDRSVVETFALPDGSGYTLTTGGFALGRGGKK